MQNNTQSASQNVKLFDKGTKCWLSLMQRWAFWSVKILILSISNLGMTSPFTKSCCLHVIQRQICRTASQKSLVACSTFYFRSCLSPTTTSLLMFLNLLETFMSARLCSSIQTKQSFYRSWIKIPLISSHVCMWKKTNRFIQCDVLFWNELKQSPVPIYSWMERTLK